MIPRKGNTNAFFIGLALIIASLILGKLVFIPVIIFPGDVTWAASMVIIYAISWVMIIIGVYLAGKEGWTLAKITYKEYQRKAIHHVKEKSKNAAHKTVKVLKHPIEHSRRLKDRLTR